MTNMNFQDADALAASEALAIEARVLDEVLDDELFIEGLEHTDRMAEQAIWDELAAEIGEKLDSYEPDTGDSNG